MEDEENRHGGICKRIGPRKVALKTPPVVGQKRMCLLKKKDFEGVCDDRLVQFNL